MLSVMLSHSVLAAHKWHITRKFVHNSVDIFKHLLCPIKPHDLIGFVFSVELNLPDLLCNSTDCTVLVQQDQSCQSWYCKHHVLVENENKPLLDDKSNSSLG